MKISDMKMLRLRDRAAHQMRMIKRAPWEKRPLFFMLLFMFLVSYPSCPAPVVHPSLTTLHCPPPRFSLLHVELLT